ncbi:MAG: hypothetical protein MK085_07530, partial [Phycisphaerales bacterium]|nr:hypothetical protein [Phycisphaerales bacterium]
MSRRSYMSSRRRSRRGRLFLIFTLIVVAGFGGWWLIFGGTSEASEEQATRNTTVAATTAEAPKATPRRILDTSTMTTNVKASGNVDTTAKPEQPSGAAAATQPVNTRPPAIVNPTPTEPVAVQKPV